MNPTLKRLAERALVDFGVAALSRRRLRSRTLVLAYHNVLPAGRSPSGDSSLHLPRYEFALQLDALAETHDVVSIDALLGQSPASARPRVVLTFDDAYHGALTSGVEELVRRNMPATIFVAPALLGSVCWWDVLGDRTGGVVPEDTRRHALRALAGRGSQVLDWANAASPASASGRLPRIGTESQLTAAASAPGITLGSHTWSHPNLSALTEPEVHTELATPLDWLRACFRSTVPWLSYPYGSFTRIAQKAAARAGYLGAFRIDGGWIPRSHPLPSYAIPRLNIPSGISIDGFRLRLAGL